MTQLLHTPLGEAHKTTQSSSSHTLQQVTLALLLLLSTVPSWAATLSGTITCKGKGIAGIVVSDGYAFATTNSQGAYALSSDKRNGYIFYVIPSGYMPLEVKRDWETNLFGGFWHTLTAPEDRDKDEQHDFALQREDNKRHVMVFEADPQLANKKDTKDMYLYEKLFLPRIKREQEQAGRTPIYSTVLGDLSWDNYWYSNHFTIADYKAYIAKHHDAYRMRHFSVTGNHDNNPSVPHSEHTDYLAAASYRQAVGPNYYSYNIGQVHYVVLDDIVYQNRPNKSGKYRKGIAGTRDYETGLTDEQLVWLEQDLSYVDISTPVFVSMHAPAWAENSKFQVIPRLSYNNTTDRLCQILRRFSTVHIMSGHRHQCYNMQPKQYPNIMEHSLGAVGGNLWTAGGYTGHPTCVDGTPGGYQLFTIDGRRITWQLRTLEGSGQEQFRIIDANTVKEYQRNSEAWQSILKKHPGRQDFAQMASNTVLVNVFNYDHKWHVRILENGIPLPIKRIRCEDPYAVLASDIPMYEQSGKYSEGNSTRYNTHTFCAVARHPNSHITVEVTDRFDRTYRSTKQFPIPCTLNHLAPSGR